MALKMKLHTREKAHRAAAAHRAARYPPVWVAMRWVVSQAKSLPRWLMAPGSRGGWKLPYWVAMSCSVLKEKSVPSRLRVREMPKARAISLPLNQRLMMALWATTRLSEPAPKMSRPAKSVVLLGEKATIMAPRVTRTEKRREAFRVPSLSMSTPPMKTVRMAAKE